MGSSSSGSGLSPGGGNEAGVESWGGVMTPGPPLTCNDCQENCSIAQLTWGWVGVIRVVLTIPATPHHHCYAGAGWPRCVDDIQRNFIIQAIIYQKVVIRREILREISRTQTFSYLVIQGWENHGSYFERTDITLQPVCNIFMQRMPC